MKAVIVRNGHGPAEDLYIADNIKKPSAQQGQALIKVYAFGVNRMDLIQRATRYPLPANVSSIMGVEYSGVIEEIGGDGSSTDFQVGDSVFGLVPGGAYAEYVVGDFRTMMKMPHGMSYNQAAAIPETWFTAIQVLRKVGEFAKRDKVVVHAGASGIGTAVVQLAQTLGCRRVFATVGSDEKKEFVTNELTLKGALCDEVVAINYHTEDFAQVVKKYDPDGVQVVIDPVGSSYLDKNIDILGPDGRLVIMGLLSGSTAEIDLRKVLYKRLKIHGTTLRARSPEYQEELRDFFVEQILPRVSNGKVKIFVDKIYPWEQIADAHLHMESNANKGKIVVTVVPQPFSS